MMMAPAQLPADRLELKIGSLQIGQSGFCVPWAMWVDLDNQCWLNPDYRVSAHPGGTVQMRVSRAEDGFYVVVPPGERWSPSRSAPYAFTESTHFLPVGRIDNLDKP